MNTSEKKLKKRFVRIAMGSLLLVIILLAAEFYFVGYNRVFAQKDALLDFIAENDGVIPVYNEEQTAMNGRDFRITPETRFENRYFSVIVNEDGSVADVINDNIASVSMIDALDIARAALNRGDDSDLFFRNNGTGVLRYRIADRPAGGRIIVFVDVTNQFNVMLNVAIWSTVVMGCLVILFFIAINLFSGAAVRPFMKNRKQQAEFITNASHELKTPLAVISANNEMTEMLSGKTEWTESTARQIERLTGLIGELIILSRLDEKAEMGREKVDFSAILQDLAQSFGAVAAGQGKTLAAVIPDGVTVLGEERFIREMASALIDNAVKYCDDGGDISVGLSAERRAVLTVSNSYAAGGETDYSRFFERFYRADESHNNLKRGYGIGLSMVQSVVEKSDGSIKADWKDGTITFTVRLPTA